MRATMVLPVTMLLCAACTGPAGSANPTTAGPAVATGEDAPVQGPDPVCETVRPTGSNIAARTCRPRTQASRADPGLPSYVPAAPPTGGGGKM